MKGLLVIIVVGLVATGFIYARPSTDFGSSAGTIDSLISRLTSFSTSRSTDIGGLLGSLIGLADLAVKWILIMGFIPLLPRLLRLVMRPK
jgi:hypothetical protein